jgi:hypothetical protein
MAEYVVGSDLYGGCCGIDGRYLWLLLEAFNLYAKCLSITGSCTSQEFLNTFFMSNTHTSYYQVLLDDCRSLANEAQKLKSFIREFRDMHRS